MTTETPAPPRIVVLCGSTRFRDEFRQAMEDETLDGAIVLSIGCNMRDPNARWADPADAARIKTALDELHKRKIDLADECLVVSDEAGYFGDSTRSEIAYAEAHGKPVRFAHPAAAARWAASVEVAA